MLALLLAAAITIPVPFPTSGSAFLETGWRLRLGDGPAYAIPGYDDSRWRTATIPSSWRDDGLAGQEGIAWYRLRYVIAQEPDVPLAVRFEGVGDAFEVYVDGVRVGGVGELPPHAEARPDVPYTVLLPPAALALGAHVLAVRIYVESDRGGIRGRVRAGAASELLSGDRRTDAYLMATALILLGLSFYQFLFWIRRPQSKEQLYLVLFIVTLAGFFLSSAPSARLLLSPWVYWYRLFIAFGLLSSGFFCYAYRHLFELERNRVLVGFGVFFHALVPFGLFLPEWAHLRFLVVYLMNPALLLAAIVLLVLAVEQVWQGVEHARTMAWAAAVLALAIFHDIVYDWGWLGQRTPYGYLIPVGALVFVMGFAYVTARRFVDTETTALYDRLTGLYRREVVLDALRREIRRAARTRQPLSVIMMDVDHFKAVNDHFGHQTGDRVLAEIGRRLAEAGRAVDWLGRYGGEEFLAVLADSDILGAELAAERFRTSVSALPVETGRAHRVVTLSAGVAAYDGGEEWTTTETLIGAADAALYRAKAGGRNRTERQEQVAKSLSREGTAVLSDLAT